MWTLLREISLRHAGAHRTRTLLVVVGIALGVCLWVAMLITNDSLIAAFEDLIQKATGRAQLVVSGSEAGIPMALTRDVMAVPGVSHAAPVLEEVSRLSDGQSIMILGIDLLGDPYFSGLSLDSSRADGADPLAFVNDPSAIIITRELATTQRLGVGSSMRLATARGSEAFTVRAVVEPHGMLAAFGGQVAVMFLDNLQIHFARGESVDRIDVALSPGASAPAVRAALEAQLAGVSRVEPARARASELSRTLGVFREGLVLSGLSALLVSIFLVYNAVAIAVVQRRKEVAILRALGVRRAEVMRLFAFEGALWGVLGGILGVLAAGPLARFVLAQTLQAVDRFVIALSPADVGPSAGIVATGIASGALCSVLAAYIPAREASRVDPAHALSSGRVGAELTPLPFARLFALGLTALGVSALASTQRSLGAGIGAVLALGMGLVCLTPWCVREHARRLVRIVQSAWGVPGRVALDHIERGLARSSITVVALMLAVCVSVSVSTWIASLEHTILGWVDDAFPADLMITAGSPLLDQHHLPIAETTLEQVRRIPGVAHAYGVRSPDQIVRGERVQLMSLDTQAYLRAQQTRGHARPIVEGPSTLSVDALFQSPRALVSENLARRLGLHPGSTLTYDTPSGSRSFTVYAVVRDFSSPEGWVLCDRRYYRDGWQDESLDQIDVILSPTADPRATARAIRSTLRGQAALFVMDHAAFKAEIASATRRTFAYARAPEWITLFVALLGVLASTITSCLDRTREAGLLRAVGATRRQVIMSVVLETAILGLIAAVLGVLAGIPQGMLLVKVLGHALTSWEISYSFPLLESLRTMTAVIAMASLGALWPARRLAMLDVSQAIAQE